MKFVVKTPQGPQLSIVVGPGPYARGAAHAEASTLLADFPGARPSGASMTTAAKRSSRRNSCRTSRG